MAQFHWQQMTWSILNHEQNWPGLLAKSKLDFLFMIVSHLEINYGVIDIL